MTDARWVVVDPDNGVPPWRQIRDQLVHLIRSGALPAGSPFPPIRQLARDLGLAAGTVARVYRDLEVSGLLVTAGRRGTFVADLPPPTTPLDPVTEAPDLVSAVPDAGTAPVIAPATPSPATRRDPVDAPPAALAEAAARFVAEVRALGGDQRTAEAAVRAAWPI